MALSRLTEIVTWIFENKVSGVPDPAKRPDGVRVMDNFYLLLRAMGHFARAYGANLTDDGSIDTEARFNILDSNGNGGLVDADDEVVVWDDTGRQWNFTATSDDKGAIGRDQQQVEGGGWMTNGYNGVGFLATLYLQSEGKKRQHTASEVALDPDAKNPLTAALIPLVAGSADLLGTVFGTLKTAFENTHDGTSGEHEDDTITGEKLASTGYLGEGFINELWGLMEDDEDVDGFPDGWLSLGGAECTLVSGGSRGIWRALITTTIDATGIQSDQDFYRYQDYLGKVVTFAADIETYVLGNGVYLEIYDGVDTTTSDMFESIGGATRTGIKHTVNAAATELSFRIKIDTGGANFAVDAVQATVGKLQKAYSDNPVQVMRRVMRSEDQANWFPNGDVRRWSNGTDQLPDFLQTGGGSGMSAPDTIARETGAGHYLFGNASLKVKLQMGQGFYFDVFNLVDFVGSAAGGPDGVVTFSVYMLAVTGGGTGYVRVKADDGVLPNYIDSLVNDGHWIRPAAHLTFDALATMGRFSVEHRDGAAGDIDIYLDGFMITKGGAKGQSIVWRPASMYRPIFFHFAYPGAVSADTLYHEGTKLDIFPSPAAYYHTILAKELTAPTVGAGDIFALTQNGAPSSLAATVPLGKTTGVLHLPAAVQFAAGDLIQVGATPSDTPGEDAGVLVEGFTLEV